MGEGRGEGSAASISISQIGSPIGTVSPSSTSARTKTPAYGDGASMLTLSVTTSTSGSYFSTRCPGSTSHLPMTPSVTDSPTCGSSIVVLIASTPPTP